MSARLEIAGARWPRGLRRDDAAAYVGVSPSKFDDWVARRIMPAPKQQDGVKVWDRLALDAAFEMLPDNSAHQDGSSWAHLYDRPKVAAR